MIRVPSRDPLRRALEVLLEQYTPQAIVAELKGAINNQAEDAEESDTRQRLRNLAALLPSYVNLRSTI